MIDPDIQAFIAESERFYPPDAATRSIVDQRRLYHAYAHAFAVRRPSGIESQDAMLATTGRSIPLRRYMPRRELSRGLVLYAHGGGFMLGSLDSHDSIVARVAEATGAEVIAIDYRLAPEHPAPAALDDIMVVLAAALMRQLPWPDLPLSPVALMGDSAGAALMAAAALQAGKARPGRLAALALVYPSLGYEPAEPACRLESAAPMLTLADVRFYRSVYLAGREPPPGTFVLDSPDVSGLPPTVLLPAEHDPLRDDCTELARRLRAVRTEVLLLPGTGLVHGCLRALDRSPAVAEPFGRLCAFVARRLHGSRTSP
ncbi:alpha/beta hydrolase [Lichenifustis flavocetrariae]|uniref:Alpha/beta hydrolase n=1 Tax=Lichenifustis flavocetrariae TaxID=2949735 RepID=A0AA41YVS0_9HYPH|nr:alpha/beta hydrolase [Lichenifustis flavocetrariae]MCW6509509.1 alpha/beta hydrolase [Lichenifustis flavocetrariae]